MRSVWKLAGVVLAFVAAGAAPAFADAVVVPNVLDAAKPNGDVGVTFTNVNASIVYIQQCWKSDADPKFDLALDCSQFNTVNPVIVNGKGRGVIKVFNGDDPNLGEWSCGTKGSPGVPNSATCYLRVSPELIDDVSNDQFFPITWANNPPPPPSTLPPPTVPGFTTTIAGQVGDTTVPGAATTVPGGSVPVDGSSTTTAAGGSTDASTSVPVDGSVVPTTLVSPPAAGEGSGPSWVIIAVVVAVVGGVGGYLGVRSSRRK